MISTFLVAYHDLVPVVFLLIALACIGIGHLALRHPHGRWILWTLLGLGALLVVTLTLVPTSISRPDGIVCTVQFSVPTLGGVETLANIALFFPLTFFAALATRRPLLILAAGSGLSVAIESLQAVVPAVGRACDTNDWLMNTIGVVAGILLAWATSALTNRVAPRARSRTRRRVRAGRPGHGPGA